MNREELVERFTDYLRSGHDLRWKGQMILVYFLRWWFDTKIQNDHEFDGILWHLAPYLVDAMEYFRTSDEEFVATNRANYLKETGTSVFPVLTDISAGLARVLIISHIAQLMAEITGWKKAESEIEGYFRAEDHVLSHALHAFNRSVWSAGMWQMIRDSSKSGMSGQFGKTEFGTFYTAGRVMMTFSRPSLSNNEQSVSFVADYDDSFGIRTGLQSAYAPLKIAVEMIEEVALGWPSNADDQQKAFQANEALGIL